MKPTVYERDFMFDNSGVTRGELPTAEEDNINEILRESCIFRKCEDSHSGHPRLKPYYFSWFGEGIYCDIKTIGKRDLLNGTNYTRRIEIQKMPILQTLPIELINILNKNQFEAKDE